MFVVEAAEKRLWILVCHFYCILVFFLSISLTCSVPFEVLFLLYSELSSFKELVEFWDTCPLRLLSVHLSVFTCSAQNFCISLNIISVLIFKHTETVCAQLSMRRYCDL